MNQVQPLGRTDVLVPRLGMGTMTWGDPSGLSRYTPAKLAYGGAEGAHEEARVFEAGLAAGVTLFDTAAMYSNGASERRLGELARGTLALIATKFPRLDLHHDLRRSRGTRTSHPRLARVGQLAPDGGHRNRRGLLHAVHPIGPVRGGGSGLHGSGPAEPGRPFDAEAGCSSAVACWPMVGKWFRDTSMPANH
jgi:hypothetical protein